MAIAREYHKLDLFIASTCNPQCPEITHSILPSQQSQDRHDCKFHLLLSKPYDECVALPEPLLFLNVIDIEALNHLHRHYLLLVLIISKTPHFHNICLYNTVFLLTYPTNFDKQTNEG